MMFELKLELNLVNTSLDGWWWMGGSWIYEINGERKLELSLVTMGCDASSFFLFSVVRFHT